MEAKPVDCFSDDNYGKLLKECGILFLGLQALSIPDPNFNKDTFDNENYVRFLTIYLPRPIKTLEGYKEVLQILNKAYANPSLSQEEKKVLELYSFLAKDYFEKILREKSPLENLQFLMGMYGKTQKNLWKVVAGKSTISEIMSQQRNINRRHAIKLGQVFNVNPAVFLDLRID